MRWGFLFCAPQFLLPTPGIRLTPLLTSLRTARTLSQSSGCRRQGCTDPMERGGRMKGIVFNLLEEVVTQHQGADTWDALLENAGLDGAYTSLGSYPDEQVFRLVAAASLRLDMPAFEVLRWFGREAMPSLASRYPGYFTPHTSTRSFILSVNAIIHPEVRKIYPGADVPTFGFFDDPDGSLLMTYRSPRRLCALAHGFIEGAARHFGEALHVDHLECMHRGDPACRCRITFHGKQQG